MTQKQYESWIKQWYYNSAETVKQWYKKPSYFKIQAENGIKDKMQRNGGWGYRVLSGNTTTFVAAYMIGDTEKFIVETYANTYYYDY